MTNKGILTFETHEYNIEKIEKLAEDRKTSRSEQLRQALVRYLNDELDEGHPALRNKE